MDSSSSSENYSIESVSSTNNDQEESMRSVSSRFQIVDEKPIRRKRGWLCCFFGF